MELHWSDIDFAVEQVRVCIGIVRYLHKSKHFCNRAVPKTLPFSAAPNESHRLIFEYNVWFSQRERQRLPGNSTEKHMRSVKQQAHRSRDGIYFDALEKHAFCQGVCAMLNFMGDAARYHEV